MSKQTIHPAIRLKLLRQSLHLTPFEFANELDVNPFELENWELGTRTIPEEILLLIEISDDVLKDFQDQSPKQLLKQIKSGLSSHGQKKEEFKKIENSLFSYLAELSGTDNLRSKIKITLIHKLLKSLSNSKGLTIKFVQLLSYLELGLPIEVRMALGNLQGNLEPQAFRDIKTILENAYHAPLEEIYSSFEKKPIAVTSLAQIHRAKLKNGTEVAVKILCPEIKDKIKKQFLRIEKLGQIAFYLGKEPSGILNEFKRAVDLECDYVNEAKIQEEIRALLINSPTVIVPKVYQEFCRPNILVTEFIHAENFHSFAIKADQNLKNDVAETIIRVLTILAFSHNLVHGDIHPENFLIQNDKVVLLDFGRFYHFPETRMNQEIKFYQAILREDKEAARKIAENIGFAKDLSKFNFDDFWIFLLNSQAHILKDGKFKFTKDYVARLGREGRRFNSRYKLKQSPESFWTYTFSSGVWALLAELEAECNWREIAFQVFDQSTIAKQNKKRDGL